MRKKFTIVMAGLAAACALGVSACGNNSNNANTTADTTQTTETSKDETQSKSESSEESKAAGESSTSGDFSAGKIEGQVYTNKMLGIKLDLSSSDINFAGEEELLDLDDSVKDRSDAEAVKAFIDGGDVYLDMYAYNKDYLKTVNIILENVNNITGVDDVDSYIDQTIPELRKQFEASDLDSVSVEKAELDFLGEKVSGIDTEIKVGNVTQCQRQVFVQAGDYIAAITSSGEDAAAAQSNLDLFTKE